MTDQEKIEFIVEAIGFHLDTMIHCCRASGARKAGFLKHIEKAWTDFNEEEYLKQLRDR